MCQHDEGKGVTAQDLAEESKRLNTTPSQLQAFVAQTGNTLPVLTVNPGPEVGSSSTGSSARPLPPLRPLGAAQPKPRPVVKTRRQEKEEKIRKITTDADSYENGELPSGGWKRETIKISDQESAVALVSKSGKTVRVGKNQLWVTREQMEETNSKLKARGSLLELEELPENLRKIKALPGGLKGHVQIRPKLRLDPSGPDGALAKLREAGAPVTYADCHRNAVVSAGYGYDPARDERDCEVGIVPGKPALPSPPKIKKEIRDAFKDEALGNLQKYTSHVGERNARAALDTGLKELIETDPAVKAAHEKVKELTDKKVKATFRPGPPKNLNIDAADQELLTSTKTTWSLYTLLSACAEEDLGNPKKSGKEIVKNGLIKHLEMKPKDAEELLASIPKDAFAKLSKSLGINEACKPEPGDCLAMVPAGASELWGVVDNEHTRAEVAKRQKDTALKILHTRAKCERIVQLEKEAGRDIQPDAITEEMFSAYGDQLNDVPVPELTPEALEKTYDASDLPDDDALEPWNMHWACVAMKDGDEYVTFENFSVEQHDAINDKWIFGTYGDKGFYGESMASGFFGPGAVGMRFAANPSAKEGAK